MAANQLHNAVKSLAWLEGTWRTESPGNGSFPTIKSFRYCDEIKFTSVGQPMLNYEAASSHPDTSAPMHRENGFLKVIPGTNKVKLILAHNFGVTTIEEGTVDDKKLLLESTSIARVSEGAKDPAVIKIRRELTGDETHLQQVIYMATSTVPELTKHLCATYVKQASL